MSEIVQFPTSLPARHQLDVTRLKLIELTNNLAAELLGYCNELMRAQNAPEFAAIVRKAEAQLAVASQGWAGMSDAIRKSWNI